MGAYAIFQHATDQRLSDFVTITPSTEDSEYPVENLYDSNPARPFKFTATTGTVEFDFASPVSIELVALIHHNLDNGLASVQIQANSSASWGAPPLNENIVIPSKELDGFGKNPFVDLSEITNTYRYWRLSFGSTNSAIIQLGQLWMGGTKRTLLHNVLQGTAETVTRQLIEHETDYAVNMIYDLGSKVKSWNMAMGTDDEGKAQLENWWDACHGRALPFIWILNPDINDARMVRWAEPARTITYMAGASDWHNIQFSLRELSRGLIL